MPIKNLTDGARVSRVPRIGKLHKGGAKPETGNKPGPDLKGYFRFTSGNQQIELDFAKHPKLGPQPDRIRCVLPYPTVDENFTTWWEIWKGPRLLYRGDGEYCVQYWDEKAQRHVFPEYGAVAFPVDDNRARRIGTLNLMLPDLMELGHIGMVALRTTSINDIVNIHNTLQYYYEKSLRQHPNGQVTGDLRGIFFVLYRYQAKVLSPDGGNYDKWLVALQPDNEWVQLVMEGERRVQLAAVNAPGMAHHISSGFQTALAPPPSMMLVDDETGEILDHDLDGWDDDEPEGPVIIQDPEPERPAQPTKAKSASNGDSKIKNRPDEGGDKNKLAQLHAIGTELYGKKWDAVRPEFVKWASGKKKTSSSKLTGAELDKAIGSLQDRQKTLYAPTEFDARINAVVEHLAKLPGAADKEAILEGVQLMVGTADNDKTAVYIPAIIKIWTGLPAEWNGEDIAGAVAEYAKLTGEVVPNGEEDTPF